MKVVVYQLGARRHYAVARGFYEIQALKSLHLDAAATTFPWNWLAAIPVLRSVGLVRSVLSRRINDIDASIIHGDLSFVLRNFSAGITARRYLSHSDRWVQQNRLFCRSISPKSWQNADAVYAYNGAALEIFKRAKPCGKRCVLDQTAAPWRWNTMLLQRERELWPDWEQMPCDLDTSGAMIAREEQEWDLADRIICGSQFVVDCIKEVNGPVEKCRVVPYPTSHLSPPPVAHTAPPPLHKNAVEYCLSEHFSCAKEFNTLVRHFSN